MNTVKRPFKQQEARCAIVLCCAIFILTAAKFVAVLDDRASGPEIETSCKFVEQNGILLIGDNCNTQPQIRTLRVRSLQCDLQLYPDPTSLTRLANGLLTVMHVDLSQRLPHIDLHESLLTLASGAGHLLSRFLFSSHGYRAPHRTCTM